MVNRVWKMDMRVTVVLRTCKVSEKSNVDL